MNLFWDTSAFVALLLEEVHTPAATCAWDESDSDLAWRWLRVETEAALIRRNAAPDQWKHMDELLVRVEMVDLSPVDLDPVCRANRQWRLRASDAGHLHCFRRAAYVMPDLQLVSFDEEMLAVARASGLQIWQPPGADGLHTSLIHEAGAAYGSARCHVLTSV